MLDAVQHHTAESFTMTESTKKVIAANGTNRATLSISVPANALVDTYQVKIKAARANFVSAELAGEVRPSDVGEVGENELIIDFGRMVTVNGIRLPLENKATLEKAYPWLGAKFDSRAFKVHDGSLGSGERYFDEMRTERLKLTFDANDSLAAILADLELSLPDLPSDLSLSINGAPAVWEYVGMVQPGSGAELSQETWNKNAELLVSLAAPIQALAGDATRSQPLDLNLELHSNTPGDLAIEEYDRAMRLLHRLSFNGEAALKMAFDREGEVPIALESPVAASGGKWLLLGVQLGLSGEFAPPHALPAVGPAANGISELVLGHGKAACVRLDGLDGLAQISAIRLPLSTTSSRAETRIVLWTGGAINALEAIPEAVSDPQGWSGTDEQWLLFGLPEPIDIEPGTTYWAAVIVERGEVCWKLAASDAEQHYPVRLGAPAGPWRALPAIFNQATGLGQVAGRVHVVGLAAETAPLAPIQLNLSAGDSAQLTPGRDTVRVQLNLNNADNSLPDKAELRVQSHAVGSLTLQDVDVITKENTV